MNDDHHGVTAPAGHRGTDLEEDAGGSPHRNGCIVVAAAVVALLVVLLRGWFAPTPPNLVAASGVREGGPAPPSISSHELPRSPKAPMCRILSHGSEYLDVGVSNVGGALDTYFAAASVTAPDAVYVQRGRHIHANGVVSFEGRALGSRVVVLRALSNEGEKFLILAHESARNGKPTNQAQIDEADVAPICEFVIHEPAP